MNSFSLIPEEPGHSAAIDRLNDRGFGRERFRKTVYKLRKGVPPVASLSLVALDAAGRVAGSLRFWPVAMGVEAVPALLLGPLVVDETLRGGGIGSALMRRGLDLARAQGHRAVVLVGDEPYYRRFGFERRLARDLLLPGPVDAERFLGLELASGGLEGASGMLKPAGGGRRVAATAGRAA
ncbi:MAG: N-acetyltransferase [Parvibaculaceae bacterium]|nr:N-acetyltransferase [Parvibaculaceae bacterium]